MDANPIQSLHKKINTYTAAISLGVFIFGRGVMGLRRVLRHHLSPPPVNCDCTGQPHPPPTFHGVPVDILIMVVWMAAGVLIIIPSYLMRAAAVAVLHALEYEEIVNKPVRMPDASPRPPGSGNCPHCGAGHSPIQVYCMKCGKALKSA